jgi:hypothetical protein
MDIKSNYLMKEEEYGVLTPPFPAIMNISILTEGS